MIRDLFLRRYGSLPPSFAEDVPDYKAPTPTENTQLWDIGSQLGRTAYKLHERLTKKAEPGGEAEGDEQKTIPETEVG